MIDMYVAVCTVYMYVAVCTVHVYSQWLVPNRTELGYCGNFFIAGILASSPVSCKYNVR